MSRSHNIRAELAAISSDECIQIDIKVVSENSCGGSILL